MGNKPQVTLTFGGDEKQLTRAMERVDKGAHDMASGVDDASRKMASAADEGFSKIKKSGDDAAGSFEKIGKGFSASAGLITGAGMAIGANLVGAIGDAMGQADVGAMLAARLGGGADRAKELGAIAGKVYGENFGESMGEVSEALQGVIGSNLVDEDATDEDVKRVTEKLLTVGQVVGESTSRVAMAVQQMLRTGLADSAEEAFNLIVRAQQQGLNKSEDLLDTLNEYGTQFRKLGLDGPTALGLISQALRAGARDSDTAADAIKEFSIRAIDGSKASENALHDLFGARWEKVVADIAAGGPKATAAFDEVLTKLKAIKDPAEQSALSVALFGTKAEDLGKALFAMDAKTAVQEMGDLQSATDDAMTAIGDTPTAQFESFKRNMETSLIETINQVAPLLMQMGQFVAQNIDVLGPLAAVIAVVTVAQWAWNAATEANPIGLIIIGIAAFVAAIVMLWNHSEGFRNFFISAWHGIRDTIAAVGDFIIGAWNRVVDFFTGLPGRIGQALGALASGIGNAFKGALNLVIDYLNWWVDRVNNIIYGINVVNPFNDIPPIPHVGHLHTGGVVGGGMPGQEVLRVLQVGEEVSPSGQGGGGATGLYAVPGGDRLIANLINELIDKRYLRVVRRRG